MAATLVAAAVVVTVFIIDAAWRGALGIPRNDDWSYLRTAFVFGQTGNFVLDGWAAAMLIGQVVIAAPVVGVAGRSIIGLQFLTAAEAAVSLVVWYALLRRLLPPRLAALSTAALALAPVFAMLAVSFMSDVPAVLMQGATLLLGVEAVRRRRGEWWLIAAAAAGLVAFSIREYGIVAAAAVFAGFVIHRQREGKRRDVLAACAIAIAFVAACLAAWMWRHGLPNPGDLPARNSSSAPLRRAFPAIALTLALFIAPAAALISPRRLVTARRRAPLFAIVAVTATAGFLRFAERPVLIGDYVTRRGSRSGAVVAGSLFQVNPIVWKLTVLLAVWSLANATVVGMVFASGLIDRLKSRPRSTTLPASPVLTMLTIYVALSVTATIVITFTASALYDRYLLPLIPAVAGLVLWAASRADVLAVRARVVPVAFLVLCALVSAAYVDEAAATEGARWDLGDVAVAHGINARNIDAGFEWYSYHQHRAVRLEAPPTEPFWIGLLPGTRCATVTAAPTSTPILAKRRISTLLGAETFYLVDGPDRCWRERSGVRDSD
ncbi:MAG: glycosyltransferase family 39 protein [Actinomycetota bacterium]|nr:glycosyltransferase family 39 protein [Actinomycetota bacterium]